MEEKTMIEEQQMPEIRPKQSVLEGMSRLLSIVFAPFWVSLAAFLWLFYFTYLYIMPAPYKMFVLGIVACFTVITPALFIFLYQVIHKWSIKEFEKRERRFVPYLLGILSYATCLLVMYRMHIPRYMSGFILGGLVCLCLCALLNFKWKVSVHTAAFGLLTSGLLTYSYLFHYNPVIWLCLLIFLSGLVGTARLILRRHTLCEVTVGFVVGMFCGVAGILFI